MDIKSFIYATWISSRDLYNIVILYTLKIQEGRYHVKWFDHNKKKDSLFSDTIYGCNVHDDYINIYPVYAKKRYRDIYS